MNFDVYPEKLKTNGKNIKNIKKDIGQINDRLQSTLNSINANSSFEGYGKLNKSLSDSIEKLITIQDEMLILSNNLTLISKKYLDAENLILLKDKKKNNLDWSDIFGDFMTDLGEFRDGKLWQIVEGTFFLGMDPDFYKSLCSVLFDDIYVISKNVGNRKYLQLKINGNKTNAEVLDWLRNNPDFSNNINRYQMKQLRRGEFEINNRNISRYLDQGGDIAKYLDDLDNVNIFRETFKESLFADFNYSGFSNLSKAQKGVKILGTAASVITIGTDIVDNFYDKEDGWSWSVKQTVHCVEDVGIDFGTAAAATAAGAAIGSTIVPPVGTVVGGAAGLAINLASNWDVVDIDHDGTKDSAVDGLKMLAHSTTDFIGGLFD